MVGRTHSNSDVSCFHVMALTLDKLVMRVWDAVSHFFTWIIDTAQAWGRKPTDTVQTWGRTSMVLPNAAVRAKLEPYRRMPVDGIGFLRQSVEILRDEFVRKGQMNLLTEFNEQFRDVEAECFPKVMMAAVRAFMFSADTTRYGGPHYFSHLEKGDGIYYAQVDYRPEIKELKTLFDSLPNSEKEIVLDEFDSSNIDQLSLSSDGKKILREISRISNALVQGNDPFNEAMQAITGY